MIILYDTRFLLSKSKIITGKEIVHIKKTLKFVTRRTTDGIKDATQDVDPTQVKVYAFVCGYYCSY